MSRRQATVDVFAAIADPTRRAILHRLGVSEQPVTALAGQFDTSLSAVSQHIRVLREAGLVTVRKEGRERIYRLNAGPLQSVAEWVRFYEPFWNEKLAALGTYLDRMADQPPAPDKATKKGTKKETEGASSAPGKEE